MALKFNNWTKAYVEFKKSFGLPVVEIPDSIKEDLKSEYKPNVPVPQTNQNAEKNIIFKPLPSTSTEKPKPSPKTRSQKGKQNKKITTSHLDKNKLAKDMIIANQDGNKLLSFLETTQEIIYK